MRLFLLLFVFFSVPLMAQHACVQGKLSQFHSKLGKGNATATQQQMMDKYDMRFAHLNITADTGSTYLSGEVKLVAEITEALDTFLVELHANLQIDSIVSHAADSFFRIEHTVYVLLNRAYLPGEQIEITFFYKGTPPTAAQTAAGSAGFNNRASPTYGNRITWSLSQPYSAFEWWPCKQSLQDKLDSVWVFITTSEVNTGASNGVLTNTVNVAGGKKRYEWKSVYPISYYLVSVAVGKYNQHNYYAKPAGNSDSIFIQNFIYSNPLAFANNRVNIEATKDMLEVFSSKLGIYPFHKEKYGHAMAPFSGGMEHQTMTTQGIFTFDIVAHELGHQWFGDAVTCASWQDIWLNEGFASYCEYLAYELLNPPMAAQVMNQIHTEARFNTQLSVWVDDTTDVERMFDYRNTYRKGAAILHTIRYVTGNDSVFFHMLRTYLNRYMFKSATATQFKEVVEEVTGLDFDAYFQQWYYAKGIPIFSLKWNQVGAKFYLESKQKNSSLTDTTLFTIKVPYRLYYTGGDTTVYLQHNKRIETYALDIDKPINAIALDPDNWILKWVDSSAKQTGWVGITQINTDNKFTLSPNPVKEVLRINGYAGMEMSTEITDITGRIVAQTIIGTDGNVQVSNLQPGTYFIRLVSSPNELPYLLKFIKY